MFQLTYAALLYLLLREQACPKTCSIVVTKGNGANAVSEVVPGDCSSSLQGGNSTEW
jgi:hypothetical protein